jgi:1-acyl-sn-glycerol-3-phosphate acyltransferase
MYRLAASWCRTNLWGARWICGIRHRVIGAENLPSTPHILLSKHSSTWETLALTQFFPPLAYVAKKELLAIPFFGGGFALASPITIDRNAGTDSMQQIAAQGRERFRQGFWIVIYPEGTRIAAGTRARYKTGGARLAIELATPVLPIAHNAGYLWPKGLFGKRPGTVTISFGKPISPQGKDVQTLMRECCRCGIRATSRLRMAPKVLPGRGCGGCASGWRCCTAKRRGSRTGPIRKAASRPFWCFRGSTRTNDGHDADRRR